MSEIRIVDMDKKRFDALAGLSRSPVASYVGTEVAWLSTEDEAVIGVIVFDRTDDDFAAIVLGRDEIGRYRAFDLEVSLASQDDARGWLERMIRWHVGSGARVFPQRDTEGAADLFTPVAPPEKLHPNFVHLIRERSFFPAKTMIGEMMPHFRDVDGNFVEQFQTTGFDARLWELYLFAYLNEEELFIGREYSAPDYCVTKYGKSVAIEAVTVGPISRDQSMFFKGLRRPMTPLEVREQNANQMPLRFGSALFSKLQKKYWNLPHVTGRPLVFAIADFHDDQSMLWTATALHEYLYGVRHEFHHGESGELVIDPIQILTHKVEEKEVPSGFFFQPDTENVSAVLFSASGTISKFNRLGRQAGFKTEKHIMIRAGVCHDHDPDAVIPKAFRYLVDENSEETWGEGLSMFHNPNATYPVPEELFPSIAHHHFVDGQIESVIPPFHPYNSITLNLRVRESG